MIRPENKDIANEHPFAKKVEPERIELAKKDKKKTISEIIGKDFKSTGIVKTLHGETFEQAIKRLLKKQQKQNK
jgi:hypothetical protein|tara:strand:- start:188 stop:409 length:222 start_codon:yes stop_codon:yes gene_type:complete